MAELAVFYCFAAILVFAAFRVITVRNPVHAALFLVLAFFSSACVWMLLEAEFLAIVLVLVYVGAVMVLFLFVVMMLDINLAPLREGFTRYLGLGVAVAVLIVVQLLLVLGSERFGLEKVGAPVRRAADYSNTEELGCCSTPFTPIPSRSLRWCCWWRSSRQFRSPCAGVPESRRRIRPSRSRCVVRTACVWSRCGRKTGARAGEAPCFHSRTFSDSEPSCSA